ncbi:hypothetical protein ACXKR8_005300 [Streptacidiphilus sp. PAMC 29251]
MGEDDMVPRAFQSNGEAGSIRIEARAGLHGIHHRCSQELIDDQLAPNFLLQAWSVL